jgi:hypothetical protein
VDEGFIVQSLQETNESKETKGTKDYVAKAALSFVKR